MMLLFLLVTGTLGGGGPPQKPPECEQLTAKDLAGRAFSIISWSQAAWTEYQYDITVGDGGTLKQTETGWEGRTFTLGRHKRYVGDMEEEFDNGEWCQPIWSGRSARVTYVF